VINGHSLPVTDLILSETHLFSSSLDFSVKLWNLKLLKRTGKSEKQKQAAMLLMTIEYPEPISSISSDNLNLTLAAASENGNIYRTRLNELKSKEKEQKSCWQTGRKCQQIRFSMDSTEIYTAEEDQINVWTAQSGTNVRNIKNIKNCKLFFSVLDVWNLNDSGLVKKNKNSQMEKLAHGPSDQDYVIRLESTRETECPLMEILLPNNDFTMENRNDESKADLLDQIESLKKQNINLYSQIVQHI
jgi:WD40 repeat protein